jgi:hypothetical protein
VAVVARDDNEHLGPELHDAQPPPVHQLPGEGNCLDPAAAIGVLCLTSAAWFAIHAPSADC